MDRLYDITYLTHQKRKNLGFNYRPVLLKKTMSNRMFRNRTLTGFLEFMNEGVVEWVDSVKRIKTFFNYIVPKNDKRIN